MVDFEGQILQILNEGVTLKELLHPNFVNKLDEEFKDATVTPIKLYFVVEEKNERLRSLSLFHINDENTKNKKLNVDVDKPEDLMKVLDSINEVK